MPRAIEARLKKLERSAKRHTQDNEIIPNRDLSSYLDGGAIVKQGAIFLATDGTVRSTRIAELLTRANSRRMAGLAEAS